MFNLFFGTTSMFNISAKIDSLDHSLYNNLYLKMSQRVSLVEMKVRCPGSQEGSLTRETGKQRNSYKVRVGAFSAISVLFEFR